MTDTSASTLAPNPVTTIAYQGEEFPTASMTIFPTSQNSMPFVYLTKDGIFFLQTHRAQWESPRVRRIPRHEAHRIANLYQVEPLKQALAHPPSQIEQHPAPEALTTDAELIKQINQLTPEQLEKLSHVFPTSSVK